MQKIISKIKEYRLCKFESGYNKQVLQNKFQKKCSKTILINKGLYEYAYFDIAFLHNMLSLIVTATYDGYIPFVELADRKDGWTNWSTFFEQPFRHDLYDNDMNNFLISKREIGDISVTYEVPFNEEKLNVWRKIYKDYVVFNEESKKYLEEEYNSLFKGKGKILGVKTRGSDFTILKPFGHPIQPEIQDVISICREKMEEFGYEYIYLASEERLVEDLFEENFPCKIIVNKRVYYDEIIKKNNYQNAWQIHINNENEIKSRGLEYLSSIYLLSKCDALIGGNCGGSMSALFMNDGGYAYWKLFDLGLYGMNNYKK